MEVKNCESNTIILTNKLSYLQPLNSERFSRQVLTAESPAG